MPIKNGYVDFSSVSEMKMSITDYEDLFPTKRVDPSWDKNYVKNVFKDISFLEKFFYNLLTDTKCELKNRYMHIDYKSTVEDISSNTNNQSLEEQAILNFIKNNPTIKQEEIAIRINKSLRTVKTYMSKMQEKGLIKISMTR